jgi:transcriptional regulator with XRE-family HTH domain
MSVVMDYRDMERLALRNRADKAAAGWRLLAARTCVGMSQDQVGAIIGKGKAAVSHMENGRAYPHRAVLLFFYRQHRIDFNFFMNGDFAQLPADVQDRLFAAIASLGNPPGPSAD